MLRKPSHRRIEVLCCNTGVAMKDLNLLLAPGARQTLRLNHQLRAAFAHIMPAPALDAVALCRLEEDCLHITLTSASWLSRLRFNEKALLTEVVKLKLTANRVKWHVLPDRIQPARRASIRQDALVIPSGAAIRVSQAADQFDDPALRRSLKRVADTMQSRINDRKS